MIRRDAICVLSAIIAAACSKPTTSAFDPIDEGFDSGVQFTHPRLSDERISLDAPARTIGDPSAQLVVTVPLRAVITRVWIQAGDTVDAGSPLFDVMMPEAIDAAGRYEGARIRLDAWKERQHQLLALKAEGLAKTSEVSEAVARVAEASADLQAARATLMSAGFKESEAAALLAGSGQKTLRARQAGVVTELSAMLGETRDATSGALARVSSMGAVRIEARFQKAPGDGPWAFAYGERRTPLRRLSTAPSADPRDGAFVAWFEPKEGSPVQSGVVGRVVTIDDAKQTVFVVPELSVTKTKSSSIVRVIRSEQQRDIDVTVIRCTQATCAVTGSLLESDLIALEPAQ